MADMEFKANSAGIREVFKGSGMQAALMKYAQDLASEANSRASGHEKELHIGTFKVPPYAAHVDILRGTAVGACHTNGKIGQLDHSKFHTLNAVNH